MDTSWLDDFLAILSEGSFSRAAQRRSITQSAFSRRIRALEAWVGASLFDRSTHTVQLTAAGHRFKPAASDLLHRVAAAREDAAHVAAEAGRTLHFASTHALSVSFFPGWLRRLEEEAPLRSTVRLTADTMAACEVLMTGGRAHFLLCHAHVAADWQLDGRAFRWMVLAEDRLLPVCAPSWDGDRPKGAQAILAYTPESGLGRILAAAGVAGAQGGDVPAFSSHLAVALAGMARDGRGVAWVPHSLVMDDLAAGRLVRTGDPASDVPVDVRLVRPRARQPPSVEAFWDRLCGQARQPGGG